MITLLTVIYLYNYNTRREYEDKSILNVFAKQRMYSQMFAKDVNRLYYLIREKNELSPSYSVVEINKEISYIRLNLKEERDYFNGNLKAFHSFEVLLEGKIFRISPYLMEHSEYLKQIDSLWKNFDQAILNIVKADTPEDMRTSVTFVNNNNLILLNLSDSLLMEVQDYSVHQDKRAEKVVYCLIGFQVFIILASVLGLRKYLFRPYHQLYKGISDIGLNHYESDDYIPAEKNVKPIVDEVNGMFLKINNLISLIENMNNNNSFMEILSYINTAFSTFIPFNYIGIALMSNDKKMIKASYGVSDGTIVGLPEKVLDVAWYVSETSLGKVIDSGEARIINDLEEYCMNKQVKQYNHILLEAGVKASIALPLKVNKEPVGMIFFSSTKKNVYTKEHAKLLGTLANSIAISLNKNILTNDIIFSSILALAKLSEARDEDTGEHMERMAKYSRLITRLLYEEELFTDVITLEYIQKIEEFSPLHDIGKVAIMDDILLKPGKLTDAEYAEMKKHALFGGHVLRVADQNLHDKGNSLFTIGIEIAEGHHEKWDGTGYPYGKRGEEIPLSARIVAIADVFDALTSRRPYKEAFTLDASFDIIEKGKGKHFDPVIAEVVLNNRHRIEELYFKFNKNKKYA